MALPTITQNAPYTWVVSADANGNPITSTNPNNVNVAQIGGIASQMASADGVAGSNILEIVSGWWNGSTVDRQRVSNVFKTVTTASTGNTTVWTPAGGKKFRLMRYCIMIPANAVAAVAAVLEITLNDSGTALNLGHSVFIPSAAGTTFQNDFITPWFDLGNGALSGAANNLLQINLSFALTGGEVRILTAGTEE